MPQGPASVQELLLVGSVPASRHRQVLSVLAGLTAMPVPRRVLEHHNILRPLPKSQQTQSPEGDEVLMGTNPRQRPRRNPEAPNPATYHDLVENVARRSATETCSDSEDDSELAWRLTSVETPTAGPNSRLVISRRRTTHFLDHDDANAHLQGPEMAIVNRFTLEGHELVYNNIVLRLQRCSQSSLAVRTGDMSNTSAPAPDDALLDKSGAYMLQATLNVVDHPPTDLMKQGMDELEKLRQELDGCVELGVVNRMALDVSIK